MSLKILILNHLRDTYPKITHKGELERKAMIEWQFEGDNAARRCRELVNEKLIRPVFDEKHRVQYQYVPYLERRVN